MGIKKQEIKEILSRAGIFISFQFAKLHLYFPNPKFRGFNREDAGKLTKIFKIIPDVAVA